MMAVSFGMVGANQPVPKSTDSTPSGSTVGGLGERFPHGLAIGSNTTVTSPKLTIGNSGTPTGQVVWGTCNLITKASSQSASTTAPYDCAATGVQSGDTVFVQLATSTPSTNSQRTWRLQGAQASSTSGYITVYLHNSTGASNKPSDDIFMHFASSTLYHIFR